ncbi:MAG: hypothetical protein GXY44_06210 [Phycisphaerales bacterium]|nr:hypothetical protein [Phycisphaerales bacterium]
MEATEVINETGSTALPRNGADVGILNRIKFGLVRGFLWGWACCFSLTGLYLLGKWFGVCEWLLNYKRRSRFRTRLREAMGSAYDPRDPLIRRACFDHFTRTRCDKIFYLIFDKLPREKIINRIKFHNRDLLDECLNRGRGVYVALSHYGSHHIQIVLTTLLGYKVAGVRDPNEGPLRRYMQQKYEETFPEFRKIRMFFSDTYPRDLYRCFQDGYILGTALDVGRPRGTHLRTAKVNFFGNEREFLTGTMQIALCCGAPILQGFVASHKNFYFHIHIVGPLADPAIESDEDAILQQVMQQYADNIADHIRQYPSNVSKS